MKKFLRFLRGFVVISIKGGQLERFLNLCKNHDIFLENVSIKDNHEITGRISVKDFLQLHAVQKKTKVHIHIMEKHGLPFFFLKNKKRKAFFVGMLLCFILLVFFSGKVWNIHISGNIKNSTPEILSFLEEQGIVHGISKSELNCSEIAAKLREHYPEITWVSAKIEGTRLIFTIKEGIFNSDEQKQTKKACNLTADQDGVIVKMITRNGIPLVKEGDTCKEGDILVLGRIDIKNDAQETIRYKYVQADADIFVKYRIPYYYKIPMKYEIIVPGGKEFYVTYFKAGNIYLEFGRKKETHSRILTEEIPIRITENFVLPISFGKISYQPYQKEPYIYTEEQAKSICRKQLQLYEKKLMEKGVQISANNVTIEFDENFCISKGNLEIIKKTGKETPVEILEQPIERTIENGE